MQSVKMNIRWYITSYVNLGFFIDDKFEIFFP